MSQPTASFRPYPDESAKFLTARTDGFGARLRAVVNTIALARAFNEDFLIYWPQKDGAFHSVPSAEKTFSPLFVTQHCLDPKAVKPSSFQGRYKALRWCTSKARLLETPHVQVENYLAKDRHSEQFPYVDSILDADSFCAAFAAIAFGPYLEVARTLAQSIPFNVPVAAVHLRAGDVIYGRFQQITCFQDKVVPYPLAHAIADYLKSQGKVVILFGEDEQLCRYLAQQCDCLFATDLGSKDFDRNQRAFFDVVLMSRAKEIYAGTSNFSQLAAQIGGGTVIEPTSILSQEMIQRAFQHFLETPSLPEGVTSTQAAFASWAAYSQYPTILPKDNRRAFLDKALEFNPENVLYQLVAIADDLNAENPERATERLQKLMDTEVQLKTLYPETPKARPNRSNLTWCIRHKECRASLEAAQKLVPLAEAGNVGALLCCALAEVGPVKKYAIEFLNSRAEAFGVFDADVREAAGLAVSG